MTTYTKVWALKSDTNARVGDRVLVSLKSGATKEITVAAVFPQSNGTFILIPEGLRA